MKKAHSKNHSYVWHLRHAIRLRKDKIRLRPYLLRKNRPAQTQPNIPTETKRSKLYQHLLIAWQWIIRHIYVKIISIKGIVAVRKFLYNSNATRPKAN